MGGQGLNLTWDRAGMHERDWYLNLGLQRKDVHVLSHQNECLENERIPVIGGYIGLFLWTGV